MRKMWSPRFQSRIWCRSDAGIGRADVRWCSGAVAAQGLDMYDQAVLDPDSLHESVRAEIVDPHVHVCFDGRARCNVGCACREVVVDRFVLYLRGLAT